MSEPYVLARRKQPQQIDFGFRRAAADHRSLDGMFGPDAKALHHAAAHHTPAQRAHHFPEHHAIRIDASAGRLVSGKQLLARAETADRLVDVPKPPGVAPAPAGPFHRSPECRHTPLRST